MGTSPRTDREERVTKESQTSLRVLVVDDNHDAAMGLSLLMRAMGHQSRMIYEGLTAVETALQYQPNLVLLDLGLPGLDGWEVATQLRQQPTLKNVVLVAVTGWGTDEAVKRSADAGFDHHLVKPPTSASLKKS
jgi:two-component system, chemotaxis family, CheB/CheR fusion protein